MTSKRKRRSPPTPLTPEERRQLVTAPFPIITMQGTAKPHAGAGVSDDSLSIYVHQGRHLPLPSSDAYGVARGAYHRKGVIQ